MFMCEMYNPHHFPLGTDVRSGPQDHQQARLVGQMEEIFQISVPLKVVHALHWLMEVPGHIPVITLITVLMNTANDTAMIIALCVCLCVCVRTRENYRHILISHISNEF